MSNFVNLKATGLSKSPNPIDLEDGGLDEATNVVIRKDNIIESRRGFKLVGNSFGSVGDRLKQIAFYKNRILRHYSNKLQFDSTGSFNFLDFNGTYSETEAGLRIKSIESNSNFYFTTSDGIKKISAATPSDFSTASGYITQAGGIKAVDLQSQLKITPGSTTGFLTQDSAVAYRVLWSTKDLNNNLIPGTPSQRSEVYNPLINLILTDYMRILGGLDAINQSGSLITDGDYVSSLKLTATSTASDLKTNILALAAKIDNDILYANDTGTGAPLTIASSTIVGSVCTITFSGGDVTDYFSTGSHIFLDGFVVTGTGDIDGSQTLASVSATTVTFNTTATGTVAITGSSVVSNEYRTITSTGTLEHPTPLDTLIIDSPTPNNELVIIQDTLARILLQLQSEPNDVVSSVLLAAYIDVIEITTTATVIINITIPDGVTSDYFFQIYRSAQVTATGATVLADLFPSDELQLVYEAYPTSAELSTGSITVEDVTPDAFRGANLYTNPTTGEGILASNDLPPFAKDINRFKNVLFFANTRTRYRLSLNLLGVSNMISDYSTSVPTITITDGVTSNTYTFVVGVQEVTELVCAAGSTLVATASPASYFTINSARNQNSYYVWYKVGSSTDPVISGKTGIQVNVDVSDTASIIADKTRDTLNEYLFDFSAITATVTLTVTNVEEGLAIDATLGTLPVGFSITTTTQGNGEDATTNQILLSNQTSPALAVDATARSMVRVINKNSSDIVYLYYLSSAQDVPGKIFVESRTLSTTPFYILGNNSNTGSSFNPDISPEFIISSSGAISVANPTVLTVPSHGLTNLDQVVITGSNSTPSIDGIYTITYIDANTFSIPINVVSVPNPAKFSLINKEDSTVAENEERKNRIYYSKYQQPEAVPIINTIDVGSKDKAILRIFPLRDSLFVFKEDGLYRISGEVAPFNLALFNSSCVLIAPDSVDVSNNLIYGWTTQGIAVVSESGDSVISRPIDTVILPTASSSYTNFKTATWGVGYESDNSYTVWTVSQQSDVQATIAYRYSNLTNSWTTYDTTNVCGGLNPYDDKLYLGPGDVNFMSQERKNFDRTDYADRELASSLLINSYSGTTVRLPNVSGIEIGDILIQEQYVNVYNYNSLLKKLDNDPSVVTKDYYSSLQSSSGNDMRTKLTDLATKLDNDPSVGTTTFSTTIADITGSITSNTAVSSTVITTSGSHGLVSNREVTISGSNSIPSINGIYTITVLSPTTFSIPVSVVTPGTSGSFSTSVNNFLDIKACFNSIVNLLNADSMLSYSNYQQVENITIQESVITEVNSVIKTITINIPIEYIVGVLTVYKAINCSFTYSPVTFKDPLSFKHLREATMIFKNKAFTSATLSFSTDLLPMFEEIDFNGDGSGIFGHQSFGSGFFGGASNSAPFRTYIPRNCQRCRYINVKFTHKTAREIFEIYGTTITGNPTSSTRAYR